MTVEAPPVGEPNTGLLGTLTLDSGATAAGAARRWVRDLVPWLPNEQVEDAELLVSELATNAHLHTDSTEIRVCATHLDGVLRFEVANDGNGVWQEELGREGGRGLEEIVARLSDKWGVIRTVETIETIVWFEMKTS